MASALARQFLDIVERMALMWFDNWIIDKIFQKVADFVWNKASVSCYILAAQFAIVCAAIAVADSFLSVYLHGVTFWIVLFVIVWVAWGALAAHRMYLIESQRTSGNLGICTDRIDRGMATQRLLAFFFVMMLCVYGILWGVDPTLDAAQQLKRFDTFLTLSVIALTWPHYCFAACLPKPPKPAKKTMPARALSNPI
jgi:hypothetical protein